MKMGSKFYTPISNNIVKFVFEVDSVVGSCCLAANFHALHFGDCISHTPVIALYILMLIVFLKCSNF